MHTNSAGSRKQENLVALIRPCVAKIKFPIAAHAMFRSSRTCDEETKDKMYPTNQSLLPLISDDRPRRTRSHQPTFQARMILEVLP